jgi:predicted XRE-type DNA-binding protein
MKAVLETDVWRLHGQLSQTAAARHLKVNQPKVSALSNYRLDAFPSND